MELTLALGEQPVAPVYGRVKRALALWEVDRAFHAQCEPLVQSTEELGGREHSEAGSHELDRERQPVQPLADLPNSRHGVLAQDDTTCGRELGEERCGIVDRQRVERHDVLAGEM